MAFVALQLPYLQRMGIDFYNPDNFKTKFFKALPLMMVIIFTFGQIYPIYENSDNIMFVTEILSYLLSDVVVLIKITVFIIAQGRFVEIYKKMEYLYSTSRDEVKTRISTSDSRNQKILKCYYTSYLIAAVVLGTLPVVTSSPAWKRRFSSDEPARKLAPYLNE